jgi:hypothetical protein
VVACTPHPGYGNVAIQRGALVQHVDLTTCRRWTTRARRPVRVSTPTIATNRVAGTEMILDRGRVIYRHRWREGPIELFGTSPDKKWVLFAIDPQGSASLAADGLTLQAVSVHGGRPHTIATGLLAPDYRAWCDGKLVMTAGADRVAAHHKWLIVTQPPLWHLRRVIDARDFAFGALACAGNGIVVQATPNSATTINPRWELWGIGLEGGMRVVDRPPAGYADDSPRVARNDLHKIVFVRSRNGHGVLWAHGVGALLDLGRDDGFFGHRPWSNVTWSLGP